MTDRGGDYSIVRFEPRWKNQILELQTHLWDPDPAVNAAYFAWKYQQHPDSSDPLVYLALHEERVIAMRGFWPSRWEAGHPPTTVDFLGAGDLVVAPAHRGRWLFQRIMAFAEKDLAARGHTRLLNLSASPSTYVGSLRQGWRSVGSFDPMQRETGTGRLRSRVRRTLIEMPLVWRLDSGATKPSRGFAKLDRLIGRRPGELGGITVSGELRAAAMAALIRRLDWDGRLREARSVGFLEWRYRNPLGQYRYFYHGLPELDGYLVLHTRSKQRGLLSPSRISIVDWEAKDDRVREKLLAAAITACGSQSLGIWTATCSPTTRALLMAHDFRAIDSSRGIKNYRPSILFKDLGGQAGGRDGDVVAGRRLLDPANWDLRMLYSDNY